MLQRDGANPRERSSKRSEKQNRGEGGVGAELSPFAGSLRMQLEAVCIRMRLESIRHILQPDQAILTNKSMLHILEPLSPTTLNHSDQQVHNNILEPLSPKR